MLEREFDVSYCFTGTQFPNEFVIFNIVESTIDICIIFQHLSYKTIQMNPKSLLGLMKLFSVTKANFESIVSSLHYQERFVQINISLVKSYEEHKIFFATENVFHKLGTFCYRLVHFGCLV